MLSNDDKIASLADLMRDVRDYADLRFRYLRLDFVSKLSVLLSALVLGIVMAIVVAVALLFLAYTIALAIAPAVGGLCGACAIVAVGCIALGGAVYAWRQRLIIDPLTGFIANLFLGEKGIATDDEAQGKTDRQEEKRP